MPTQWQEIHMLILLHKVVLTHNTITIGNHKNFGIDFQKLLLTQTNMKSANSGPT